MSTIAASYVVGLGECSPDVGERIGGKALGLGALLREGLPVPPGFVVTTDAYRECVATASGVAKLTDDVASEIADAYRGLGDDVPVAVRSSATAEDTAEASFAGQQDTYLWVQGLEAVQRQVVRCWASLFTERAIGYRERFNVPVEDLAMGVVVQEMIPADVAGVMMTIDPVSGDRSTIYVAAAYGLGEGVVKGDVGSDSYSIDKETLEPRSQEIGTKEQAYRFDPEQNEVRLMDVPEADRDSPALDSEDLAAIAKIGRQTETAFGSAQDLEWALVHGEGGNEISLLQSRPETVWSQRSPGEGQGEEEHNVLHAPTPDGATWSTTNLAESIPGVPTPLGWSIWYPAGELAVRRTFETIGALSRGEAQMPARREGSLVSIFYGHAAIRVDLLCSWVERIPGTDGVAMAEQAFSAVPEGYVSRRKPLYYPRVAARSLTPLVSGPRLILEDHRRMAHLHAEATRSLPAASEAAARKWLRDGAAHWTESLYRQVLVSLGAIQPAMDRLLKLAEQAGVSGQELMAGYGGHEETRAVTDAWACSRDELDLETFIARHGHHGWRSGEISSTVWREDRDPAIKLVESYRAKDADADPAIGERERGEKRRELEAELLAGLPAHRRPQGRLVMKLAARYVPLRGVGKASFLRGLDIARAAARRLGEHLAADGRIADPEDVFYLTIDELVAGAPADAEALVAERRQNRDRYEGLEIPQSFRGVPSTVRPEVHEDAEVIEGTAAGPGRVEGLARVVTDPADAHVEEGEILIAHDTDPSWASMMFLSSGLVADIGGIMSHTAVVARELGIPCVVNAGHASRSLKTGDRVRVDGSAGRVEILERA